MKFANDHETRFFVKKITLKFNNNKLEKTTKKKKKSHF